MLPLTLVAAMVVPTPKLIDKLGHPDWRVREKIQLTLEMKMAWADGYGYDPVVAAGTRHPNPEIATRCTRALNTDRKRRHQVAEELLDRNVEYFPTIDSFWYDPQSNSYIYAYQGNCYEPNLLRQVLCLNTLGVRYRAHLPTRDGPYGKQHHYHERARKMGVDLMVEQGYTVDQVIAVYRGIYPADVIAMTRQNSAQDVPKHIMKQYYVEPDLQPYHYERRRERAAMENLIWPW